MTVDLSRLPGELEPLAPVVREWAVGDDVKREAKHESASTEALKAYWDAVAPHFAAINAYLDENVASDEPYEAIVLGTTAEGALEAALEIERRTGQHPRG